ncbi:MAG: ABC transporter permease [Planctomycetota bacterium]|jgi:lipopolysaccharide transport system permease protein/teichoic acid transport system permease protein
MLSGVKLRLFWSPIWLLAEAIRFLQEINNKKAVIYELAKRDFQTRYMGSYLGFLWVFLQPLAFMAVVYFIFAIGFRYKSVGGTSFAVYLLSGMIAWLFFAENINSSTAILREYAFLIKKVNFRLSVLPIVKLLSALIAHFIFILVAVIVAATKGVGNPTYVLQVFYYLFSMTLLLLGLGWMLSAVSLFLKDTEKFVALLIQLGFWLTPIFWSIDIVPVNYRWLIKLNPMYYIVTGYRDSIIYETPFWSKPDEALYFWSLTFVIIALGIFIFRKLRPHFAEVV